MPDPGSHAYDVERTRLRRRYEDQGVPDQHADRAANEELEAEHPPRRKDPVDRAAGPLGERPAAGPPGGQGLERDAAGGGLELRSTAFNDHAFLPGRCSRDGGNEAPPLEWGPVPAGTVELAVLCEDPDAGELPFVHWLVSGIEPGATGIGEDSVIGTPARNDYDEPGWGGPHPPAGDPPHRYLFRVYASSAPLGLDAESTADDLRAALEGRELAHGTLVGRFQR